MTKLHDLDEPVKYYSIKFVEFLDFLGRVTIDYFDEIGEGPRDLEDQVYEVCKILWENKCPGGVKTVTEEDKPKKKKGAKKRDKGEVREKKT